MKALILDGSRPGELSPGDVLGILTRQLNETGCEVEILTLREMDIHHCIGCFGCWEKSPGECLIDDPGRQVARKSINSDLVVFFTPVTFGGYSSELKKGLDRIIGLVSPFFTRIDGEVHHEKRYARYPRLLGLGMLDEPDRESEEIFTALLHRNAINMHTPAHAAGIVHANQPVESAEETIRSLVESLEVPA